MQRCAYRSEAVVRFLKHLLQHIAGTILVIWDGSPIHRSRVIRAFLSRGATARLHLERLPGYAPELNPVEEVWRYLKHVAQCLLCHTR
jgi:transposase